MNIRQVNDPISGIPLVMLENEWLRATVAPAIGGRVTSLVHLQNGREFLWRNPRLKLAPCSPGSAYDPNFYGGIDELIPTDIPEIIDGIECPDHGELWTMKLDFELMAGEDRSGLRLSGSLPLFGLDYRREMHLDGNRVICKYSISNKTTSERKFLWKLHAALAVQPGDQMICPAGTARAADPEWSRRKSLEPFTWPQAGILDMSLVPEPDGSTEFLYLYDLASGHMGLHARDGARLDCAFDLQVFPCCWYFASHGGMDGAFTAVLEPCTTMPISVNQAAEEGFCSRLKPEESLTTTVMWTVTV